MFRKFHAYLILPLLDLIYPPICLTCDRRRTDRSSGICAECWGSLIPVGRDHPVSREIRERFVIDGYINDLTSCFLFEKAGNLQIIVHHLKYAGMSSAGVELGRKLGWKILDEGRLDTSGTLVPVPLHRFKRRERGYNQSECICRGISAITGMPVVNDLLIRTTNTLSQTKLSLEERRENVKGAFAVNGKRRGEVRGASVIRWMTS
jgi:predicted amidophosphoribosyltransferase